MAINQPLLSGAPARRYDVERANVTGDLVVLLVKEIISGTIFPSHSACAERSRKATLTVGGTFSLLAKVAYIPLNFVFGKMLSSAKKVQIIVGVIGSACNIPTFFILEYDALDGLVGQYYPQVSEAKAIWLKEKSSTSRYAKILVPVSLVLAMIAQFPVAWPAFQHDPAGLKIPGAVTTDVPGALYPGYSLYNSCTRLCCRKRIEQLNPEFLAVRSELLEQLEAFRYEFVQMDAREKDEILGSLVNELDDYEERFASYLETVTSEPQPYSPPGRCRVTGRGIVDVISVIQTINFHLALALFSHSKSKKVWNNEGFGWTIGLTIAGTYLYNSGRAIFNTSRRVYDAVVDRCLGKRQPSLSEQVDPKTTFYLRSCGLLMNLGALLPTIVIWGDYFHEYPNLARYFQVSMCSSVFLLVFTATLNRIEKFVSEQAIKNTQDTRREWLMLDQKLDELEGVILSCSQDELNTLIPKQTMAKLQARIQETRQSGALLEQLEHCIFGYDDPMRNQFFERIRQFHEDIDSNADHEPLISQWNLIKVMFPRDRPTRALSKAVTAIDNFVKIIAVPEDGSQGRGWRLLEQALQKLLDKSNIYSTAYRSSRDEFQPYREMDDSAMWGPEIESDDESV